MPGRGLTAGADAAEATSLWNVVSASWAAWKAVRAFVAKAVDDFASVCRFGLLRWRSTREGVKSSLRAYLSVALRHHTTHLHVLWLVS